MTLIQTCADGPEGLMTLYGEHFPGAVFNSAMTQMNHEKGGQVLGLTAGNVTNNVHRGHVFTMIWVENVEKLGQDVHKSLEILESVTAQLRTSELVRSLNGITVY